MCAHYIRAIQYLLKCTVACEVAVVRFVVIMVLIAKIHGGKCYSLYSRVPQTVFCLISTSHQIKVLVKEHQKNIYPIFTFLLLVLIISLITNCATAVCCWAECTECF